MQQHDRLYKIIEGGLLHITSLDGYRGIVSDSFIRPNDGTRPYTFSSRGVCHRIGAVALLDLSLAKEPLFGPEALGLWMGLLTRHKPITFILDLERGGLSAGMRLLTFDDLAQYTRAPHHGQMLPDTEVCYPGPIPLSMVRRSILVDYWDAPDFEVQDEFPVPETAIQAMICRLAVKRARGRLVKPCMPST